MTIDDCIEELKAHAGEFQFGIDGAVRHKTITTGNPGMNNLPACPLNVLCKSRTKTRFGNSQLGRMCDVLDMKYDEGAKILHAADEQRSDLRKKLLAALGLEEPKKPRTKKTDE